MMLAQNRCLLPSLSFGGDDERNGLQLSGGRRQIRHQLRHGARHRYLLCQQPIDPVGDHPRLLELALRDLFRIVQIARADPGPANGSGFFALPSVASFSAWRFEAKLAALAAFRGGVSLSAALSRGEGERVLSRKRVFRLRGIASVAFAAAIPFICAHAVAGSYEQPPSFRAAPVLDRKS